MKLSQEPDEHTVGCATCGFLMTIPSAQLADYYRAHGWFAGLGLVIVLIQLAFAMA